MVADFMADHIGVRELPWRIQLLRHEIEETHVEIDDAVVRAVERAGRRLPLTTGRGIAVGIEDQLRVFIGAPELLEVVGPDYIGAAQYLRHEFFLRVLDSAGAVRG